MIWKKIINKFVSDALTHKYTLCKFAVAIVLLMLIFVVIVVVAAGIASGMCVCMRISDRIA